MDHALLTGLLLKMFAPNSSCAQGHLAKTRSSTSAIKAGSGKNRSWRLASSTSFQATRGWTAAPALGVILQHWAVQSAVWPVSCPGYKKAELTNEHVAFFSWKPHRFFFGNDWLLVGEQETSSPSWKRVHEPTAEERHHPWPTAGQLTSLGWVRNHATTWKSRGITETVCMAQDFSF